MAMEKYNHHFFYKNTGLITSILVVFFQFMTLIHCYQSLINIKPLMLILSFLLAYVLTDFINGLIHMYMDNNIRYHSFFGPFIAAFHLHHLSPRYTDASLFTIYFRESGTKLWLVIYLILLTTLQFYISLPFYLNFCLVSIGILSSLAEVSHFLCHNSNASQRFISLLQKYGILLSKKHHFIHHSSDNKNYAFLNGMSDPLINLVASYYYKGYKNYSDRHARIYKARLKTRNTSVSVPLFQHLSHNRHKSRYN